AAGPARAVPWKSGASAPRKAIKIQFGFSPRESLSVAARENDSQELKPVLSRTSDAALKRRSSTVAHAAETVVRASGTVAQASGTVAESVRNGRRSVKNGCGNVKGRHVNTGLEPRTAAPAPKPLPTAYDGSWPRQSHIAGSYTAAPCS